MHIATTLADFGLSCTADDHPFERKMPAIWGDDALLGRLANGVGDSEFIVPFDFFTVSLQQTNAAGQTIQNMLMNTLGSKTNRGVMTLMIKDANLLKEKVRLLTHFHALR